MATFQIHLTIFAGSVRLLTVSEEAAAVVLLATALAASF